MKKIAKKIYSAVKQPKRVMRLSAKQVYILFRYGPAEYARYFSRAIGKHTFAHNFPNGIKTNLDMQKAKNWYMLHKKPVVIVVFGAPNRNIDDWMQLIETVIHPHFIFTAHNHTTTTIDKRFYTDLRLKNASYTDIRVEVLRKYRHNDVFFVDPEQDLPAPESIIRLQHAAYSYDDDGMIGIVQPALQVNDDIYAGVEYNRVNRRWSPLTNTATNYEQISIPRYTLASSEWHGTYVTHRVISDVSFDSSLTYDSPFTDQLSVLISRAWQNNLRTLLFSPVTLGVKRFTVPQFSDWQEQWLEHRDVRDKSGKIRIIYVLNATSVSGGIRVIFEHVNGLLKKGFAPEIWSLQDQPDWMSVDVVVKKFNSYSDLTLALRDEDAIKVATWWETGQPVWLASVNHGIPVNFIQEFETWFYPGDSIAQAAVVSSYRKEFYSLTTAEYQQTELQNIGISAPVIPVAYNEEIYRPIKNVTRRDNTILALGRSFFQKNFAMTERAWRSMADDQPNMLLFGSEPNIITGDRVEYHTRPSNEEVNTLYNTATCFIQTSIHEGFSLPIIEAMAAGCPVITTDSHGNRGFCFDGKNCLMVEQNNDKELAEKIKLLLGDKVLQQRLRDEGLKTAQRFQWLTILDKVDSFYAEIARTSGENGRA